MRRPESRVKGVLAARARDALFDLSPDLPRVAEIDLARIRPNPDQPRRQIDEAGIAELARSVEQHGLLQPIVVKEEDGAYVLIAGQRRLLAHERLGRTRITALLATGRPDELALIENLQRQDLAPLDEAEALSALKARYGYSQDELARSMAKAKSTVSELLSLTSLPEAIKREVRTSEPPVAKSVLIELARLGEPERQLALWQRLRQGRGTVRAARAAKTVGRGAEDQARAAQVAGERLLALLGAPETATLATEPRLNALLARLRARLEELLDG